MGYIDGVSHTTGDRSRPLPVGVGSRTESVPEGLAFDCSATALGRADMWNLVTSAGRLDIAFAPSGTQGYGDLSKGAVRFETFTVPILAASLDDIIRSKAAADRPQDRQDVPLLRAILRRQPGR